VTRKTLRESPDWVISRNDNGFVASNPAISKDRMLKRMYDKTHKKDFKWSSQGNKGINNILLTTTSY
jgi:hypothetical protein